MAMAIHFSTGRGHLHVGMLSQKLQGQFCTDLKIDNFRMGKALATQLVIPTLQNSPLPPIHVGFLGPETALNAV